MDLFDGRFEPMLAKKYVAKLTQFPVSVQPKFNGYRSEVKENDCWTRLLNDHSPGMQLNMFRNLQMEMPKGIVFDGEIYAHGKKLQEIISLGKDWRLESSILRYHVYDCVLLDKPDAQFQERFAVLQNLFRNNHYPTAVISPCNLLYDDEMVQLATQAWVDQGYEGIIIRDPTASYRSGRHGRVLQKKKLWQSAEWRILDVTEGTGKAKGSPTFHCKSRNGTPFKVAMVNGSYGHRNKLWVDRSSLIGQLLTVEYQDVTRDFVPSPIRECIVRNYE